MGYYVGLDVSLKSTHICVLDGGSSQWFGAAFPDTQIAMLAEHLARWGKQIVLVGLETGSLTPWLYHGLSDLGLYPWFAADVRAGLPDAAEGSGGEDGQGGCSCASGDAGERVVLFGCSCEEPGEPSTESSYWGQRDQLVRVKRQLYGQSPWPAAGPSGSRYLQSGPAPSLSIEAVRDGLQQGGRTLYRGRLLARHACERGEPDRQILDKQVRTLTQKRKACWHLMSVPGVGPDYGACLHGGDRRSASFWFEPGCWGPIWA